MRNTKESVMPRHACLTLLKSSFIPENFVVPVIPEIRARYSDVGVSVRILNILLAPEKREALTKLLDLKSPQEFPEKLVSAQEQERYITMTINTINSLINYYLLDPACRPKCTSLPNKIRRMAENCNLTEEKLLCHLKEGLPEIAEMTLRLVTVGRFLKEKGISSFKFISSYLNRKDDCFLEPGRPDYFGYCLRLAINDYLTANSGEVKNPQGCQRFNPTGNGGFHTLTGTSPS